MNLFKGLKVGDVFYLAGGHHLVKIKPEADGANAQLVEAPEITVPVGDLEETFTKNEMFDNSDWEREANEASF